MPDAEDRVRGDDRPGHLKVLPAALRRSRLVGLDVGDRAEALEIPRGHHRRRQQRAATTAAAAFGAWRLAMKISDSSTMAPRVRNPAREKVMITAGIAIATIASAASRPTRAARDEHQRAGNRDDQVQRQGEVVRIAVSP